MRETTILVDENAMHDSALVEFKKAEAIPDVLEKDKKKFEGTPVSISMLWRSTLFVTNFPREMDDGGIRNLLEQVRICLYKYFRAATNDETSFSMGGFLRPDGLAENTPTRGGFVMSPWNLPLVELASVPDQGINTYLQAAAQEALVLHGYKVPGASTNFGLTVLISDPSAKTKRSDAANSTLFVGGLNNKSTEVDIKGLFNEVSKLIRGSTMKKAYGESTVVWDD